MEEQKNLQEVTKKLVIFTAIIIAFLAGYLLYLYLLPKGEERPFIVLFVFICGLLGGFVSIQQRLPSIEAEELKVLSQSWVSITLIPINGGIFALVLMLMFVGGIIQGELFPEYREMKLDSMKDVYEWMKTGFPTDGKGIAKLFFWSFVAGFSERLVPQVIRKTVAKVNKQDAP